MKPLLLVGAALAALTTPSLAADFPAAPVDMWSGYYAGVQGGYAWSADVDGNSVFSDGDIEGGFGGLYYGRNWQSGSWVYGLDGSISFGDVTNGIEFNPGEVANTTLQGFSTSRVKVGYAFDNVLVYAAAGFSLARFEIDVNGNFEEHEWMKGFTVGGGLEAKIADNWSARVEYLYIDYGSETFSDWPEGPVELEQSIHAVRAGVAYHF